MPEAPRKENTGGIVVTFHPDAGLVDRLKLLSQNVDRVLVVDNASPPEALAGLRDLPRIEMIVNDRNLGVAAALNQGAEWARKRGYAWALLSDQDSRFHEDAISVLGRTWAEIPHRDRLAVLACNFDDAEAKRPQYRTRGGASRSEQKTVITSGSLVPLDALAEIGPFREAFFIDHVDHEFCLRARRAGRLVAATREALIEHSVGAAQAHGPLGTVARHHGPERWYFMVRNETVLAREYLFREPGWVLMTGLMRLRAMLVVVLFERQKIAKLWRGWVGFWAGLFGRV